MTLFRGFLTQTNQDCGAEILGTSRNMLGTDLGNFTCESHAAPAAGLCAMFWSLLARGAKGGCC